MAGIRLEQFSGIAPKISDLLLPPNMAADARNARLLSGELRSILSPKSIYDFSDNTIRFAYRIPDPGQTPDSIWVGFKATDVDFVEGIIVKNADPQESDRYFWTGDPDHPYMATNSRDRIRAGSPAYKTGVPIPSGVFSVDSGGTTLNTWQATTAYVKDDIVIGTATENVKFVCVTAGTSGGSEPSWDTVEGNDTTDNTVVWRTEAIGNIETRAYTYTYVNDWNQESAPADPVLADIRVTDSWEISGLDTSPADAGYVPVNKIRIYRTVVGKDSALYYYVDEIDITPGDGTHPGTYSDTKPSTEVVQNNILNTFNWDLPPESLEGLITHPGGFMVGFVGNELFFSEYQRPWAWPTEYIIALEHKIVGLAIFANQLVALTESQPYYLPGTHPSNLSLSQSEAIEPCLSKRSIVSTIQGVLYASPNGLVLFNNAGAIVVTNNIVSEDEWQSQFSPTTVKAAQNGLQYLAFYSSSGGFEFSPAEPLGVLSTFDQFEQVDNIITDQYNGDVYLMINGVVYKWDSDVALPVYYTWRSKIFDFPKPLNMGALIVKMDIDVDDPPPDPSQDILDWNEERMKRPLNPIGYVPIGGTRWAMTPPIDEIVVSDPDIAAEISGGDRPVYPMGGTPLFTLSGILDPSIRSAIIRVYAENKLRYNVAVRPNRMMRLPSGFKAHYWQVEVLSNVNIYSIAMAETGKELVRY